MDRGDELEIPVEFRPPEVPAELPPGVVAGDIDEWVDRILVPLREFLVVARPYAPVGPSSSIPPIREFPDTLHHAFRMAFLQLDPLLDSVRCIAIFPTTPRELYRVGGRALIESRWRQMLGRWGLDRFVFQEDEHGPMTIAMLPESLDEFPGRIDLRPEDFDIIEQGLAMIEMGPDPPGPRYGFVTKATAGVLYRAGETNRIGDRPRWTDEAKARSLADRGIDVAISGLPRPAQKAILGELIDQHPRCCMAADLRAIKIPGQIKRPRKAKAGASKDAPPPGPVSINDPAACLAKIMARGEPLASFVIKPGEARPGRVTRNGWSVDLPDEPPSP